MSLLIGLDLATPPKLVTRGPAAPVNTALPVITGTAIEGQVVSVSNGTWGNSPSGFAYQWRRGGAAISGAVGSTYTLLGADCDATISCTVTASNAGGAAAATSAGIGPVRFNAELLNEAGSGTITSVPNLRVSLDGGATWLSLTTAGLTIARDGTNKLRVSGFANTAARDAALFHYEQKIPGEPNNAANQVFGLFARRAGTSGPVNTSLPGIAISATRAAMPIGVTP